MVASITVLGSRLSASAAPFDGGYFLSLANPGYYTTGGEPPGRWCGAGAAALDLQGLVESDAFKNVLAGLRPNGQRLPGHRQTKATERVPGYDLCFSAPKSVSALWATAPPEIQRQIEIAFDTAVRSTLQWVEQNVPLVRRGRGGCYRQLAELVIAMFDHGTSRIAEGGSFEPQMHRHCVVANIARGPDGRWSAVDSRALHAWTRSLGPMFRATLAAELVTRLAVPLIRPNDAQGRAASWFEIGSVPAELCRHWSSRREEIDRLLEGTRRGLAGVARAQAREEANLASRAAKKRIPPRGELFAAWRAEAGEFGFVPTRGAGVAPQGTIDKEAIFQAAWQTAVADIEKSQSSFTLREGVQRICEAAQTHGVTGAWLADRLAQHLSTSPELRPLGEISGEARYTTQSMWRLEQSLFKEFTKLLGTAGATVPAKVIDKALASRPELLPEQREAARQLLAAHGSIRALAGKAGTGKSFTLDVVRDAFERAGYRVIGGALAGVAKEELAAKAGIKSRTVASYLYHFNKSFTEKLRDRIGHDTRQLLRALQGKPTYLPTNVTIDEKTVLIVDEAGMLDTKTFRDLCRTVRAKGGTVLFVGDTAQLQPIAAGGPFRHLLDKLAPAQLHTNLRQRDEADRAAAEKLREGQAKPALTSFQERDRLVTAKDRGAAIDALVNSWAEQGGASRPAEHVIFTPTRAEAQVANRFCQAERQERGELDRARSLRHGDDILCAGDRVLFHKNRFADGIRNGYRGIITGVDRFRGRVTIRLDGDKPREVTIRLRDYGPDGLTLGYAQTTHKGQGQTVNHAYLLVGGKLSDREMIYVQATRGKLSTRLFTDEAHAGEDLKALAQSLARSRPKELAHDLAERARPSLTLDRSL